MFQSHSSIFAQKIYMLRVFSKIYDFDREFTPFHTVYFYLTGNNIEFYIILSNTFLLIREPCHSILFISPTIQKYTCTHIYTYI